MLDQVVGPVHDPSPDVVPAVLAVKRLVVGAIVLVGLTEDEGIIVIGRFEEPEVLGKDAPPQALTNRQSVMVPRHNVRDICTYLCSSRYWNSRIVELRYQVWNCYHNMTLPNDGRIVTFEQQ